MHAAGITCTYEGRVCNIISNIIEFGSTMESIVANIKQNKQWHNKIFANDQDVEMLSTDS